MRARVAVDLLDTAHNEAQSARHAWEDFLQAAATMYSKLEQGAKASRPAMNWYGGVKHLRKVDPLLRYLHMARDSHVHTIKDITRVATGEASIRFRDDIDPLELDGHTIMIGTDVLGFPRVATSPGAPIVVEHAPGPELALVAAYNRGTTYEVPATHLGSDIGSLKPWAVARLALAYLEKLYAEAEALNAKHSKL